MLFEGIICLPNKPSVEEATFTMAYDQCRSFEALRRPTRMIEWYVLLDAGYHTNDLPEIIHLPSPDDDWGYIVAQHIVDFGLGVSTYA